MIMKFKFIKKVINDFFNVKIDFSRDEGVDELMRTIDLGDINRNDVKSEFELMLDSDINWREFGVEAHLVFDRPEVTNEYVKNYLLFCIHDVLWPEKIFTMSKREDLVLAVVEILKKQNGEEKGWLSYNGLYKELKTHPSFEGLEFFNLNHVFFDGRGVFDLRVIEKDAMSIFQICLNKLCLEHDIYDLREPNEPYPPYLL